MKRYLVTYINTDGEFSVEPVNAESIIQALQKFLDGPLEHAEVFSITLAR